MPSASLPSPGEAPAGPVIADRAAALDDSAEWESFGRCLESGPAERWESYMAIQGMYCPACSLIVEEALQALPGVRGVQVNGATSTVRVEWSPDAGRPSQWVDALKRRGYGLLPAGDELAAGPRRIEQRMLLWRWLVAGFCMSQVMMYTVPIYLAEPDDMTADVVSLLRWACWILTLPVLLFSSRPFFVSAWRELRHRAIGMDVPVALGLAIAFAASTVATFDPQGPMGTDIWYDSVTMFVFFLLSGRLLEQRLRDRTAGALQSLLRTLPETVERERADGGLEAVPVRRLRAGDRIRVLPGEVIPADGVLLEGETRVDEALLTGESRPLLRCAGEAVVAGSHNLGGSARILVERAGPHTRFAEIVALMERAAVDKPRIARLADRLAQPFLAAVVLCALLSAWFWWSQGAAHALGVAVAVLIVTCPCALSLATPAASLAAAGALARRGVLVRRLDALEAAATVDTVLFDKTGTLTQDRMAVVQVHVRAGESQSDALQAAAALARHSLHPAARAVAQGVAEGGWVAAAVTEHAGQGLEGFVAGPGGAQPVRMRLGSAGFCGLGQGAGAEARVHLCDGQGWLAGFELDESLKPQARESVAELAAMGMEVELLSGDRDAAVQRLGQRAGIARAFGARTPEAKLEHVTRMQAMGRRVGMVGDGMNDGPVLARADVSIAMGQGVPVAQARSDFIALGGQVDRVALVFRHARRTRAVVRQNLAWAAGYNALCVPLAVLGWLPPWLAGLGMAASSLVVVANAARLARADLPTGSI